MIAVGQTFMDASQRYECVGLQDHTRRDGSKTMLAIMQSECAQCGHPFSFTMPTEREFQGPNRRCQTHKRPGQKFRRKPR